MFAVSKIVDVLTQPGNLLILFLLLACGFLFRVRRQALGRKMVAVLAMVLLLVAVSPLDAWLVAPLEERFPRPVLPARVDGIVVLGGSVDPQIAAARGQPSLNGAAERLTALIELGLRYPEARLVFTGGSGSLMHPDLKEAPVVAAYLASQGFAVERVLFEAQSRNTHENATLTHALVAPKPEETWVLVTSASHMPRSVGAFHAAGWHILPYPVDYTTPDGEARPRLSLSGGARAVEVALHERLGMAYYRLRGWSDALYPAP